MLRLREGRSSRLNELLLLLLLLLLRRMSSQLDRLVLLLLLLLRRMPGRVGTAATGCSCCCSCGVINPSPATRERKTAEQSTTESKAGCSDKNEDVKQSPFLLSQKKEESSQLILKEEKTSDEHKRVDG